MSENKNVDLVAGFLIEASSEILGESVSNQEENSENKNDEVPWLN